MSPSIPPTYTIQSLEVTWAAPLIRPIPANIESKEKLKSVNSIRKTVFQKLLLVAAFFSLIDLGKKNLHPR